MKEYRRHAFCVVMLSIAAGAATAAAQAPGMPKSQLATLSQMLLGTRIDITYRRPVARGRELYGSLVPWGRVWTPSADSAAYMSISGPLEINGKTLAAGSYSIWAIPQPDTFTVIFNAEPHAFHLAHPEGHDVLKLRAATRKGEHMETLAFYFPMVDSDSASLYMQWGTTIVPLSIHAHGR